MTSEGVVRKRAQLLEDFGEDYYIGCLHIDMETVTQGGVVSARMRWLRSRVREVRTVDA